MRDAKEVILDSSAGFHSVYKSGPDLIDHRPTLVGLGGPGAIPVAEKTESSREGCLRMDPPIFHHGASTPKHTKLKQENIGHETSFGKRGSKF